MPARSDPQPASRNADPLAWCWAITLAFLALALHRLTIPSQPYFDEVHYLPAARAILAREGAEGLGRYAKLNFKPVQELLGR